MEIRYLKNPDIDREAWDQAVGRASNGLIYAYSWYLDQVCRHWDALVFEDYKAVFPLPWNAKLGGIKQVYQPYFTQQLGLFGKQVNTEMVKAFLDALPEKFRLVQLALNEENHPPKGDYETRTGTNYLLSLKQDHQAIFAGYNKSLRKRIRKANDAGLQLVTDADQLETFVSRYHLHLQGTFELPAKAYLRAQELLNEIHRQNHGRFYRAVDANGNNLAEIFLPQSHQRLYYIMGYATPEGKQQHATHFLLDQIFQLHAQSNLTFDFEGSSIDSIAQFFASFGAKPVPYPKIKIDKLPTLIRWIQEKR